MLKVCKAQASSNKLVKEIVEKHVMNRLSEAEMTEAGMEEVYDSISFTCHHILALNHQSQANYKQSLKHLIAKLKFGVYLKLGRARLSQI